MADGSIDSSNHLARPDSLPQALAWARHLCGHDHRDRLYVHQIFRRILPIYHRLRPHILYTCPESGLSTECLVRYVSQETRAKVSVTTSVILF